MTTMQINKVPEDWTLITDSQDIESLCKDIGASNTIIRNRVGGCDSIKDIGLLFVDLYEGEYTQVWAHYQNIPHLSYYLNPVLIDRKIVKI